MPKLEVTGSFDHFVGGREERWRHRQAERLRRLEIDDEIELSRLFYRQVAGLRATQNFVET